MINHITHHLFATIYCVSYNLEMWENYLFLLMVLEQQLWIDPIENIADYNNHTYLSNIQFCSLIVFAMQ